MHRTDKLDQLVTVTARTAVAILQRAQAFDILCRFMEGEGYQVGHFEANVAANEPIAAEITPGASTPAAALQEMADAIHKATGLILVAAVGNPQNPSGETRYTETRPTRRPDRSVS